MSKSSSPANAGVVLSVSELNREARTLLESGLPALAVAGELSNMARPQSGHVYFSLKDEQAQIRCAFFRQRQRGLNFQPQNGDEVIVFGRVSLYEPRGDYQLIVEHIEASGAGALQRRFEALKQKLAEEGLFDQERKRVPPTVPGRIGVITSPSGAAIRDILHILARRFPAVPIRIYPVAVQGTAAPVEIVAAIDLATKRNDCDVLIVARGGGSIEDLWAFNEEVVARAIAACPIPVIAGIGHETDTTIADFVADIRAPTPSGAAEIAVPDQTEWMTRLKSMAQRLRRNLDRQLSVYQQRLDWLTRSLAAQTPAAALALRHQRLRESRLRMNAAILTNRMARRERLTELSQRLQQLSPALALSERANRLDRHAKRLETRITALLHTDQTRLAVAARALDAISPLATLARGYAIATESASGQIIRDASPALVGTTIDVRLHAASLQANVSKVTPITSTGKKP